MTIKLRGHHLLCLLTYKGHGYTPAFSLNFTRIVRRLSRGEEAMIVAGADDLCQPMLCEPDFHCADAHSSEIDRQALADIGQLLGRDLAPGERLVFDADSVAGLRQAFLAGEIRTACQTCSWLEHCNKIAENGFHQTRLKPSALQHSGQIITLIPQ